MSADLTVANRSGSTTAPPGQIVHVALASAMVLAPWGFVVANTCYALAIRGGGSDETGAEALALFGAHPRLALVATLAAMVGSLLVVPAVLGVLRLAPASRLIRTGGSLMIAGYICYFGVVISGFTTLAMTEVDGSQDVLAHVIDASESNPWSIWVFLLFVIGNLIGTTLLATGLLRSHTAPMWAALGILAWPVLHVTGLIFFGNEVPQVIGAVLQALGFAGCAVELLLPDRRRRAAGR